MTAPIPWAPPVMMALETLYVAMMCPHLSLLLVDREGFAARPAHRRRLLRTPVFRGLPGERSGSAGEMGWRCLRTSLPLFTRWDYTYQPWPEFHRQTPNLS